MTYREDDIRKTATLSKDDHSDTNYLLSIIDELREGIYQEHRSTCTCYVCREIRAAISKRIEGAPLK